MYVEELTLENIRCFDRVTIKLKKRKWITLLSQNGCGKSTILQSMGMLLAGPEAAQVLVPRPVGWLRDEQERGKLSIKIHQSASDPGRFGSEKVTKSFGYSFFITGSKPITVSNKSFSEPGIHQSPEKRLAWLRQNAFVSKGTGWFAVGYGAFRRLTRKSEIIVPSLEPQARYTNFISQFDDDQPLSAFERWMVYLDYRISKSKDTEATRQRDIGIPNNKVLI